MTARFKVVLFLRCAMSKFEVPEGDLEEVTERIVKSVPHQHFFYDLAKKAV